MTHAAQVKKAWNYEQNAPRCTTCTHYRGPYLLLINSLVFECFERPLAEIGVRA